MRLNCAESQRVEDGFVYYETQAILIESQPSR